MKKPSSTDRAAGPTPRRGRSLWAYAACIGVAGIAAIGLVAALIFGKLLPAAGEALEAQSREAQGRTYAALFDGRLLELRRWMAAAATAPAVRDALTSGDAAALREAGVLLDTVLDFADRVEVYLPGAATLDSDAAVPISYAALDVVKRAQTGVFVGPEAIEGERKAIYVAQPVEADGAVIGVVFAAIGSEFFLDPLASFDTAQGQLTLQQSFDSAHAINVLAWGDGDPQATPQRLELAAPYWALIYQPGRHALPDALDPATATTPLLGAFVLFAIVLLGVFLRLAGNVRHDAGLISDAGPGIVPNLEAFRLAAFAALARELSGRLGAPAGALATAAPAPEPTAGLAALSGDTGPEAPAPADEYLEIEDRTGAENASVQGAGVNAAPDGPIEGAKDGAQDTGPRIDPEIFRAYDIRGITGRNLTEDAVYWIGRAFAAEALERDLRRIAVGRDGRHSSLPLRNALVRGLTEGGAAVVDIGEVPTPLLYFATHALETGTGIMITGSHNPPEYNGLKMVLGGETLAEAHIQALRERIEQHRLPEGTGQFETLELRETYLDRILSDVVVAQPLKIVVDCGNGVAGAIAPELLRRLDCEVVPLYCDVDGDFPNHHPDPADPRNLEDLITVVQAEGADLGLAFDGDGDRLGVVTASGKIIWPDKLMMLFAQDIVGRNPGADIIYDVKCSRHLNAVISELGGRPIMWKTGHSNMKAKLKETGALLAGEFSGHICFGERWYGFDDALYTAARLLEILGAAHESADELFGQFPRTASTPELKIRTTEQAKFAIVERLAEEADFGTGILTTIDGIRVDFEDGWGLIRPSNTSPTLTLRFEADNEQALERIQAIFAAQLSRIDPDLKFR